MRNIQIAMILTLALALGCMNPNKKVPPPGKASEPPPATGAMAISSPAFENGGTIPAQFTCNGAGAIPPLTFSNVPQVAHSIALEVTDPDAPNGTFTHWLVWNIPTNVTEFKGGDLIPDATIQGLNGFGTSKWGSPCPPSGVHHYVFDLYALDNTLPLTSSQGRDDFEKAIKGHVVAQAKLVGMYGK
ncbi:MAG TPA: YbhB/YbcL family Raf kinase inhibitor-like protein [Thermoanaerobaculia bacterium]|nr:YbhB/YbcL family Raf kinase inhibitor-like protein [Thermoanaerobaculia bacterium]